jgi:hypothetical protein
VRSSQIALTAVGEALDPGHARCGQDKADGQAEPADKGVGQKADRVSTDRVPQTEPEDRETGEQTAGGARAGQAGDHLTAYLLLTAQRVGDPLGNGCECRAGLLGYAPPGTEGTQPTRPRLRRREVEGGRDVIAQSCGRGGWAEFGTDRRGATQGISCYPAGAEVGREHSARLDHARSTSGRGSPPPCALPETVESRHHGGYDHSDHHQPTEHRDAHDDHTAGDRRAAPASASVKSSPETESVQPAGMREEQDRGCC